MTFILKIADWIFARSGKTFKNKNHPFTVRQHFQKIKLIKIKTSLPPPLSTVFFILCVFIKVS